MTALNREIWRDAYRVMEQYEAIPPGDYDTNKAYWDGLTQALADLSIKYRNDQMAWALGCAIHEYINDRYKALKAASDGLDDQTRQNVNNQLFAQPKSVQTLTEQMSMMGV